MDGSKESATSGDGWSELSPAAREELGTGELVFWAGHLLRWNSIGRQLFPQTRPVQIRIVGDAGPTGWGARVTDGPVERET
eukprot:COSAG01_NODE_64462_length_276_cov_0.875706_1_plen_80_part_10